MSRHSLAVLVAALAVAGCGHSGSVGAPTPEPIAANLWIAPVAGKSPERCATPCDFDPDKAYDSFQAAYSAAASGDRVRVKAGRYGKQIISTTNRALEEPVTFTPARGETVEMHLLQTDADWLTFKDMRITAGAVALRGWHSTGNHVTLDNVDITGPEATITIDRGSDVTYKNGEMGTRGNTVKRHCANGNSEPVQVVNTNQLTLSNVTFWPFVAELGNPRCGPDSNMHLETVRINDNVKDLVIDRVRFMPGDGSGSGRLFAPGGAAGALIVNSYFGPTNGPGGGTGATITLGRCDGWVFAYNSWAQGLDDSACAAKPTYVGNLAAQPDYLPCPGSEASHNLWVWTAARTGCGTDRWVIGKDPNTAVRRGADGYHLTEASPAIDAGDEALCARYTGGRDIDGDRRTGRCDAGPDEYVP